MKTRLLWMLPGGTAIVLATLLGWQRLQANLLRAELEAARDRQSELLRLRSEREKLLAQQVPAAELERLRADRVAIERLRGEISAVRTSAENKQQAAAVRALERFAVGQKMPAAEWRNAGAASPLATLETALWAALGGEVDVLARLIQFDPEGRSAARTWWEGLPPAERARHPSPEHLMALMSVRDIPTGSVTVEALRKAPGNLQPIGLRLTDENGKARSATLVLVRAGEEWKLHATGAAVAKYAAALRAPPPEAGK